MTMTEDRLAWIKGFESGRIWLTNIGENSADKYLIYLKSYCDATKYNPDQLLKLKPKLKELMILVQKGDDTIDEDTADNLLKTFFLDCKLLPNPRLMLKNAVFSFYKHNGRPLNPDTCKNVNEGVPVPKEKKPSLQELTELSNETTTARDDALLFFDMSTSIRVGSIPQLFWKDLKPTQTGLEKLAKENKINWSTEKINEISAKIPFFIEIEAERLKGKGKRKYKNLKQITFVNYFAWGKMEKYRVEAKRKEYELTENSPIFIKYRNTEGDVKGIEPLNEEAIGYVFDVLSTKAWGDKSFSIHDIRSFFQSALEDANINVNLISLLMGHKVGSSALSSSGKSNTVDQHYSSHQWYELLEKYVTALPNLIPRTTQQLEAEIQTHIEKNTFDKAEANKTIANQQTQLEQQEKRMSDLEGLVRTLVLKGNLGFVQDKEKFESARKQAKKQ